MKSYPYGVWPVMLTPFTDKGEIDEDGLYALVDWYIQKGVDGLFASCQSSEIFHMTFEERMRIAKITVNAAHGRVPVIGSGFTDYREAEQVRDIYAMRDTGVEAVILLTNRLASEGEDDDMLLRRLYSLLEQVDDDIPLGLYECPFPYKRLLSPRVIREIAATGRFHFLKDTSLNAPQIREKLAVIQNTPLKLYNAHIATLLESLRDGAYGFSGIMANFHPEVYVWLTRNVQHPNAEKVQHVLTAASLLEHELYPTNAKYFLREIAKLPITIRCRTQDDRLLSPHFMEETRQVAALVSEACTALCQ